MYKLLVKTQQKRETKVKTKHFHLIHISACFPKRLFLLTLFSSVVGDVEFYFFKTPNHHDKAPRD